MNNVLTLWINSKVKRPPREWEFVQDFLQKMMNRMGVGYVRYGTVDKRQRYMTRLEVEFRAYKKTGNKEHLLNIANYAVLESMAPEHKKFHDDSSVDSVTRGRV